MVSIASAGGTGAVGRTLLWRHHAIILTRKDSNKDEKALAPVLNVDYGDINALKSFLEEHNIHTVISAFGITATSLATTQLNLIRAADASSATKQFIPSSFAIPYPEDGVAILPPLEHYFTSLKALKYFAPPALKTRHPHSVLVVDMEHNAAGIPGDGNAPVTLTYTFDVARFVVAALDLEAWPRELRIVGDEVTFNQLVAIAEEVKGARSDVAYGDVEKLRASRITELPSHAASYDRFPKEWLQWSWPSLRLGWPQAGVVSQEMVH